MSHLKPLLPSLPPLLLPPMLLLVLDHPHFDVLSRPKKTLVLLSKQKKKHTRGSRHVVSQAPAAIATAAANPAIAAAAAAVAGLPSII